MRVVQKMLLSFCDLCLCAFNHLMNSNKYFDLVKIPGKTMSDKFIFKIGNYLKTSICVKCWPLPQLCTGAQLAERD